MHPARNTVALSQASAYGNPQYSLILGIAYVAAGFGLYNLQRWAYRFTLVITVIVMVLNVISVLTGDVFNVVGGIVLFYLNQSSISTLFDESDYDATGKRRTDYDAYYEGKSQV